MRRSQIPLKPIYDLAKRPTDKNMTTDVDVIKEGMEGLIRVGYYKDREALLEESFRIMLEVKPTLRSEMAAELYKSGKVSLSRAAEIAGVSQEGFKNIQEQKGIKRVIEAPSRDEIERGVEVILGTDNNP